MDKKQLSEQDIRTKFITPAVERAGRDLMTQLREEFFFTKGRIIVRGRKVSRGKPKFADYVLYHRPSIPIAVVEAKDNNHTIGDGMQLAWEADVGCLKNSSRRIGQSNEPLSKLLLTFPSSVVP